MDDFKTAQLNYDNILESDDYDPDDDLDGLLIYIRNTVGIITGKILFEYENISKFKIVSKIMFKQINTNDKSYWKEITFLDFIYGDYYLIKEIRRNLYLENIVFPGVLI